MRNIQGKPFLDNEEKIKYCFFFTLHMQCLPAREQVEMSDLSVLTDGPEACRRNHLLVGRT